MAHQLVAAPDAGLDELGAVVIERGIEDGGGGELELVEQREAAPGADPVAIVAPGIVEHVGLGALRPERGAQPLAEVEVLEVEAEVDRQALLAGLVVVGAPGNRRVTVARVGF